MDLARTSGFIGLLTSIQEKIEYDNMVRMKRDEEERDRLSRSIIDERKKGSGASCVAASKKTKGKLESPDSLGMGMQGDKVDALNGLTTGLSSKNGKMTNGFTTTDHSGERDKKVAAGGAAALREKKKKKRPDEAGGMDNETASVVTMKSAKSTKTQQTATTSQTNKTVRTRLRSLLYYEEGAERLGTVHEGGKNGGGGGTKKTTKKKVKEEPPPPPPPPPRQPSSLFCGTGGNGSQSNGDGIDFSKQTQSNRKTVTRPPSPPPSQRGTLALFCGVPSPTPNPNARDKYTQPSKLLQRPPDSKSKGRCVIS